MKKLWVLAIAAFLVTGTAFAQESKDGKKCGKSCCKKGSNCCSKDKKETKEVKPAAAKTTVKVAPAKA
ncbi:hypothetical protein [Asinibacterium sp. OR53]|uniref:hypothetical protein n=1 Tax=Asinibacterium sp. OR53 TaxID=925409 RepID=UPI00047B276B|nr:hypothetical protein [Asinibacterium sp. OR53]